ncbi:unnamed protein product [Euphydryas editha]|uniref:Uncharacterized protein n=1 Tax=Euphydryas editha TaxID=104508 RepID=A0AAU9TGQ8_EUPED|nr:unnamed protein product [Euphydryas editha]
MLCRWRRPAPHTLQAAPSSEGRAPGGPSACPPWPPGAAICGHERPPNVIADSGSSLVDDSTPSTFTTGVGGVGVGRGSGSASGSDRDGYASDTIRNATNGYVTNARGIVRDRVVIKKID